MRKEIRAFNGGITDFIYNEDVSACELAENLNILKDKSLESRHGSKVINTDAPRPLLPDVQKPSLMYDFNGDIIVIYEKQIAVYRNDAWEIINGSDSTHLLDNSEIGTNHDIVEWNEQLFVTDTSKSPIIKIYKDEAGNYKAKKAGLPKIDSLPTFNSQSNDGKTYIYTFVAYYEYYVNEIRFVDYGATLSHRLEAAADMSSVGHYVEISNIPEITGTNLDASNIKIRIFRSQDAGTAEYYVGEVANGTTTFVDQVPDSESQSNEIIYTESSYDNDAPPIAKYIELNAGAMLYGGIENYPDRVYQSMIGDVDSVPASFYEKFYQPVTGLSSYQSNGIVFCTKSIWRIEGVIDIAGGGNIRKILLSESVGTINNGSIVRTEKGIYFAGNDGFYFCDGYQINKIPDEQRNINERYATVKLVPSEIKGTYDRKNQKVFWTTKDIGDRVEIYCYDMTFNSFTTWTGDTDVFTATAVLAKDGELYRGDYRGYVLIHKSHYFNDDIPNESLAPDQWSSAPVVYRWKHVHFDFGISDVFKWCVKITAAGLSKTDLNLRFISYDDALGQGKDLKEVSFVSGMIWGDPNWVWGDDRLWTLEPRFSQTRRFPSGKIRCKTKQLEITNAITRLAESYFDTPTSMVTVNANTKAISLIDSQVVSFPVDSVGYSIVINEKSYKVLSQSIDTLVVDDPANSLVDGQHNWYVEGIARNQRLNLNSLIFTYELLDDDGGYFQGNVQRR